MAERQAIYESVRCWPVELCNITAAYLIERPHTWTTDADKSVDVLPAAASDADRTAIYLVARPIVKPTWRLMVSTASFADAQLNWTVEFDGTAAYRGVGAGVTVRSANGLDGNGSSIASMAQADDWIVHPDGYRQGFICFQDRQEYGSVWFDLPPTTDHAGNQFRYRLSFAADWHERTVTAQAYWSCNGGSLVRIDKPIVLVAGVDAAVFRMLRPCVVVGVDAEKIRIRSGGGLDG
jgi:hypothetical protein